MIPCHPVFLIGLKFTDDGDLRPQLRVIVRVGIITFQHKFHPLSAAGGRIGDDAGIRYRGRLRHAVHHHLINGKYAICLDRFTVIALLVIIEHIFIINPHAGKKDQTGRIYEMADRLRQHGLTCQCLLTQRSGGAEEIARRLVSSGEEVRLYACGGDGTLNEVVNGAAGFDNAAVTCIPIGTGNDFLKNFGPDAAKFTDAENLWDGEVHPLDLIDCNGRQCLTIACSGIDARVAESVHELGDSPLLSGRGSYLAAVAVNFLFRGIGQHWRVTLDDEVIEDDFALVSMCNGRYYGGGSTPVPEARMDDGVLHTVLVKNISRMKFAGLFSAYSAGRYRSLPPEVIRVVTAKNVRIQSEDDIVTCLDGETIHSRDVRLTLSEKRLNFFGPKGCDPNYGAGPK